MKSDAEDTFQLCSLHHVYRINIGGPRNKVVQSYKEKCRKLGYMYVPIK